MSHTNSPWLTVPQAAKYLQMAPQELRELVYAGKIPSYKRSAKRIFVNTKDLDALMFGLPSAAVTPAELTTTS